MTYKARNQLSRRRRGGGTAGRTGSHPSAAKNPSVLHPGLFPSVMSVKPIQPVAYSQGFIQPSGVEPTETSWSLSIEKMAVAVCLSLNQVLDSEDEWSRGDQRKRTRVRRTLVAQTVLSISFRVFPRMKLYFDDCAEMSGTPRPPGARPYLRKLHS